MNDTSDLRYWKFWCWLWMVTAWLSFIALYVKTLDGADNLAPNDVITAARADIETLPPGQQPFTRYLWVRNHSKARLGAISIAINTGMSRSPLLFRPTVCAGGHLIRLDLRRLVGGSKDLHPIMTLWDKRLGSLDPYFHRSVLKKSAAKSDDKAGSQSRPQGVIRENDTHWLVRTEPYFDPATGRTFRSRWIKKRSSRVTEQRTSTFAIHSRLKDHLLLASLAKSPAPILRADFVLVHALSTLNEGLYYDFQGIRGKTQTQYLKAFGADQSLVEKTNAASRTATYFSGVTGKPRQISFFYGIATRPTVGPTLITITADVKDGKIDPRQHAIRSLLDFKDDAREIICQKPNGMLSFALFDGKGTLQDSAPDDVVSDHLVPPPFTKRLQSAISCIRCHAPHDGYQPVKNDVQKLVDYNINIFDDQSEKGLVDDTLIKLVAFYAGDLSKPLAAARMDHEIACQMAGRMGAAEAYQEIANIFDTYEYKLVDAKTACDELGIEFSDNPLQAFKRAIPPLPPTTLGVHTEDPTIAAIRTGLAVTRQDWETVYHDVALRAETARQTEKQAEERK